VRLRLHLRTATQLSWTRAFRSLLKCRPRKQPPPWEPKARPHQLPPKARRHRQAEAAHHHLQAEAARLRHPARAAQPGRRHAAAPQARAIHPPNQFAHFRDCDWDWVCNWRGLTFRTIPKACRSKCRDLVNEVFKEASTGDIAAIKAYKCFARAVLFKPLSKSVKVVATGNDRMARWAAGEFESLLSDVRDYEARFAAIGGQRNPDAEAARARLVLVESRVAIGETSKGHQAALPQKPFEGPLTALWMTCIQKKAPTRRWIPRPQTQQRRTFTRRIFTGFCVLQVVQYIIAIVSSHAACCCRACSPTVVSSTSAVAPWMCVACALCSGFHFHPELGSRRPSLMRQKILKSRPLWVQAPSVGGTG
jgi:hypothetical protein